LSAHIQIIFHSHGLDKRQKPKNAAQSTAQTKVLIEIFQASGSVEQRLTHDNFYRDASKLIHADSKPTEEAIDRVVSKIHKE
jgi:pre-mRNA-splicing factor SYF2